MRVFLDTNALIDIIEAREPYASELKMLFVAQEFEDLELWACTQSYADAFYVLSNHADRAIAKKVLLATLQGVSVCGTFGSDIRKALSSDWSDVEDQLIALSAKQIDADFLISRDKEVIEKSPVRAMPASELLSLLEDSYGLSYGEADL